jgi:hypothetical protein
MSVLPLGYLFADGWRLVGQLRQAVVGVLVVTLPTFLLWMLTRPSLRRTLTPA